MQVFVVFSSGGSYTDFMTQTYQSHWDFNASHVTVKSAVLQAVLAANFATGLTFEFFPRTHANTVNFTIGPVV